MCAGHVVGREGGMNGVLKESIWPNRVHTCHDDPTHAVARHSLSAGQRDKVSGCIH